MKIISKRTKIILGIMILGLVVICIYQSYAIFKESRKLRFIWGVVEDFEQTPDIVINVFVNGEKQEKFPDKKDFEYKEMSCTNSGNAEFDEDKWQMSIKNITEPTECDIYFEYQYCKNPINQNLLYCNLLDNNILKEGSPGFKATSSAANTGLWKFPEATGTSYYFRGNKELLNNNVIFAGHQWKIVRIDYQGNIKLIYNGVCTNNICSINDKEITTLIDSVAFYNEFNELKYAKYSYDGVDSFPKTITENWYQTNLIAFDSYIADINYCNDTSYYESSGHIFYGAYSRTYTHSTPSLDCPNDSDNYNIKTGKLKYKIGLITLDEVLMAGIKYDAPNESNYLNSDELFWTMSPAHFSTGYMWYWFIRDDGAFAATYSSMRRGIRPMIALNHKIDITKGNGSASNPYIIKTN